MADGTVVIQVKSNAKQAASDFNTLDKSLDKTTQGANKTDKAMLGLSNSAKALGTAIAGIGLFEIGKQAVLTGFQFTALQNKFKAAAGSAATGAASFEFIKETVDELGLSLIDTADAYAGFLAAATRSGLTFAESEQIFKDVATAATSLQLPAEKVGLVFRALEQISSKGVVSMEELKLQLGDSLPGAVQIAAKSMNMTTQAFLEAVSAGEVMSKDFLPKFAKQIKDELGGSAEDAADSLQAAFNRMGTAYKDFSNILVGEDSLISSVLTGIVTLSTSALTAFNELSGAIVTAGEKLTVLAGGQEALVARYKELGLLKGNISPLTDEELAVSKSFNEQLELLISNGEKLSDITLGSEEEGGAGEKQLETFKALNEQAATLRTQLQDLFVQGGEDTEQFAGLKAQYEGITAQIQGATDATKQFKEASVDSFDFAGSAADNFSRNATRSLLSPWEEGETAADRFKEVALNTIADILAEFIAAELKKQAVALVTAVFTGGSSIASGFFTGAAGGTTASAKGNAFSGGAVTDKFANGGAFTNSIVSSPTTFPMAGGKTGLMGEAGPEAIMPLDRDSSGRLGVQVQQAPVVNNIINNAPVQIQTVSRPNNQNDIIINQVSSALADSRTSQGLSEGLNRQSQTGANAF